MAKKARMAKGRLQRLMGQMGLTSANCRKVMIACVQAMAMYGSELWWKGEGNRGMGGPEAELQKLVNQQARAVTGCYRTTNLGALMAEAGLRPATTQLDNRQRRFATRLLTLPQGNEAKKVVGAESELGGRLRAAVGYAGRVEKIIMTAEPSGLGAEVIVEGREDAKRAAEQKRAGLTIFVDGSRAESGAVGYAVVWERRGGERGWAGIKTHLGFNQEAFDAECAALERALEVAARRRQPPERVTIFSDAQAALARITSDEPGPGQQYALKARKWIEMLRKAQPNVRIELRWCPAHEGVEGNERADKAAKTAADKPDERGVEWLGHKDRYGRRHMPLPRSIANIRREVGEKKWAEARDWSEKRIKRKKYKMPEKMRQQAVVAEGPKRLAERFHQLRTGHCRTAQYLEWTKNADTATCGWCQYKTQTREHLLKHCKKWKTQQKTLWAEVRKKTGRGKDRFTVPDLLADKRCTGAVLGFLRTTRVGSRTGPPRPGGGEEGG